MADQSISSRLRRAITSNDRQLAQRLLRANPSALHNPDFNDKSNTSLHLTAQRGLYEIAVYLIDLGHDSVQLVKDDIYSNAGDNQGVSVNTDGHTPLHLAAANSQTPMTELLCQKFPHTINRGDIHGLTPLLLAAKGQHKGVAPASIQNSRATSRADGDTSTIEILLEYGADVGAQDHLGNTCLHNACAWGNLKAIRVLVQAGADPLCSNYAGWRPGYYSLTVQAEVYYKNLVTEYENMRAEEMRIVKEQRVKDNSSVRLVSAADDEYDGDAYGNHSDADENDSDDSGQEEFYQSRSRAGTGSSLSAQN